MGKRLNGGTALLRRLVLAAAVMAGLLLPLAAGASSPDGSPDGSYVVISLADRRLYLAGASGETRASFPVAIGRPGVEIPIGVTTIVRKRENPTWHPTPNQRRGNPALPASVPPGPDNPLGRFALDLGWPTYAIHGTNDPASIGKRASAGCFRMAGEDIETLFSVAAVGTPVRVMAETYQTPRIASAPVDERGVVQLLVPLSPPVPATPVLATAAQVPVPPAPPQAAPPQAARPQPVKAAEVTARIPAPPAAPAAMVIPAATPAASPVPEPPPADPRCTRTAMPVLRVICDTPDLALLDGRIRQKTERLLAAVPPERRAGAADMMTLEKRRFEERISALCWVRAGTEQDHAATAMARLCLKTSLENRLEDMAGRAAY